MTLSKKADSLHRGDGWVLPVLACLVASEGAVLAQGLSGATMPPPSTITRVLPPPIRAPEAAVGVLGTISPENSQVTRIRRHLAGRK
jgi:hypothetical protein